MPTLPRELALAVQAVLWAALAVMGWVAFSLAIGVTRPFPTPLLQAVAPLIMLPALPLIVLALWYRWSAMLAVASLVFVMELIVVVPVVLAPGPPKVAADAPRLTVRFANLLYDNQNRDNEARTMNRPNVDVVAMVELHPEELKAMEAGGGLNYWPYRITKPGRGSEGLGLLSRYPIVSSTVGWAGTRPSIRAVLNVQGRLMEVFVVHPLPPVDPLVRQFWASDLEAIRQMASVDPMSTMVIGDFNAVSWHPPLHRFLSHGFRDAHIWTGHGLSRSWPMDWSLPPFVRLDHALVRDGLVPTSVKDFTVPGSDHRGFVVDLAVTK